jgi:hypothetical protein
MVKYLGLDVRETEKRFKLTRDNYIVINNKAGLIQREDIY